MGYQKDFCCSECKNDNIQFQVWADENNIVQSGSNKDTNEVWHKNHGKILYDLWETDKRISNK